MRLGLVNIAKLINPENQSIQFIIYKLLSQITSITKMTKQRNILKGISKNQPETKPDDQNKPKNQAYLKGKKDQDIKQFPKPLQSTITVQQLPLTSYRLSPTSEQIDKRKWQYLTKFQHMLSKAHFIYSLKNSTLFLSYSLAEKTVQMVLKEQITFDYWTVSCMFMSMKYEEIYPPRLRDLQNFVKIAIESRIYCDTELRIWEYIGEDMNFLSLNTMLSEYLHAITKEQRFFVFYLLEISLNRRIHLKKFSQRELVISVMYIFSSQKFSMDPEQTIDGVPFKIIQECAKGIILIQIEAQQSVNFMFKKYRVDNRNCVALKGIPHIDSLRNLLEKKVNQPEKSPKIVGFCPEFQKSEMVEENEEIEALEVIKKRGLETKFLKPRY